MRRFIDTTSSSLTPRSVAILVTSCGLQVAFLERVDLVLHPAKVEEQLLLRRGGAHLHKAPARRMNSWIEARIHHIA